MCTQRSSGVQYRTVCRCAVAVERARMLCLLPSLGASLSAETRPAAAPPPAAPDLLPAVHLGGAAAGGRGGAVPRRHRHGAGRRVSSRPEVGACVRCWERSQMCGSEDRAAGKRHAAGNCVAGCSVAQFPARLHCKLHADPPRLCAHLTHAAAKMALRSSAPCSTRAATHTAALFPLRAHSCLPGRPAHALYFAAYEAAKEVLGGNEAGHHPLATSAAGTVYVKGGRGATSRRPWSCGHFLGHCAGAQDLAAAERRPAGSLYKHHAGTAAGRSRPCTPSSSPGPAAHPRCSPPLLTPPAHPRWSPPPAHPRAGTIAVVVNDGFMTPWDVVKQRMQVRAAALTGGPGCWLAGG